MSVVIPEISVIVPAYNVERFLPDCFECIIGQTFSSWELLVADDGSSDRTGQIADDYAKNDERIKVIHTSRQGVSAARNTCIKISCGRYLAFVDSDDRLEPKYLEELYNQAEHNSADIAQCSFRYMNEIDNAISEPVGINAVYDDPSAILNAYFNGQQGDITTSVWSKLFRRAAFSDICFDTNLRVYEDAYYVFQCCLKSKKVVCFNSPLYFYIQREDSTTHAWISEIWIDYFTFYERQKGVFHNQRSIIKKVDRREAETGLWLIRNMIIKGRKQDIWNVRNRLINISCSVIFSSAPLHIKIKLVALVLMPHLYLKMLKNRLAIKL